MNDIGVIGLSVMGQNLALNIASRGYNTACWNRTYSKVEDTVKRAEEEKLPLNGFKELSEFVGSLKSPKCIIIMVQAGNPVDLVIESLVPLLSADDIIVDGGNEWYKLTEKRAIDLEKHKINYIGMGVSGGEEGARYGPALLPGGSLIAYKTIEPILKKIAAKGVDGPCVSYIGKGGSGNFVKMVHNGIEYGDMQIIGEAYLLLKAMQIPNDKLSSIFGKWNQGSLQSFLIEITQTILKVKDDINPNGGYLLDKVSDKAGNKGTGKWTVQVAADYGVPCSIIAAALESRYTSALTNLRKNAQSVLSIQEFNLHMNESELMTFIRDVEDTVFCAKICAYSQGMHLLYTANEVERWGLNLSEISRIWTGGCIIRANLLSHIRESFLMEHSTPLLIAHPYFSNSIKQRIPSWRRIVAFAVENCIPVPALSAALAYYDSFRLTKLPTVLIQAQRDLFGAHGYERNDREGTFHTKWVAE